MKIWSVFGTIAAILALAAVPPGARAGTTGVGVVAGEPTGVSFKTWLDGVHAVDGAIGLSLSGNTSLQLQADYLWHEFGLLSPVPPEGRLPVYYGIGCRLKVREGGEGHDTDRLGVRFPVGIAWIAPAAPVDLFFEIVPVLDMLLGDAQISNSELYPDNEMLPDVELNVGAAIGVRFWFR